MDENKKETTTITTEYALLFNALSDTIEKLADITTTLSTTLASAEMMYLNKYEDK
jgi:hypothetical protein